MRPLFAKSGMACECEIVDSVACPKCSFELMRWGINVLYGAASGL